MFLKFKLGRLGEQDLDDCLALLAWGDAHGEPVDRALAGTPDTALVERREHLAAALGA